MGRYLSRQLASIIPTILLSIVINFVLLHLAPGDPARVMAGKDNPTEEQIEAIRKSLGLDQPLPIQFLKYIQQLLHGNLGDSLAFRQPVFDLIMSRLPATLLLTVTSALIALGIGTLLGVIAAQKNNTPTDTGLSFGSYALFAVPSFWLWLIMIVVLPPTGWFPSGMRSVGKQPASAIRRCADHLVLPGRHCAGANTVYFAHPRQRAHTSQEYMTTFLRRSESIAFAVCIAQSATATVRVG